jgi:hypothetical protein
LFLKEENGKAAGKSTSPKEKNKTRATQEESEQEFD